MLLASVYLGWNWGTGKLSTVPRFPRLRNTELVFEPRASWHQSNALHHGSVLLLYECCCSVYMRLTIPDRPVLRAPRGLRPFALKTPIWVRHSQFHFLIAGADLRVVMSFSQVFIPPCKHSSWGLNPRRLCPLLSWLWILGPCHSSPPTQRDFLELSMCWFHQGPPTPSLPKSLLPHKVTFTVSRDKDVVIFGGHCSVYH